MKELLPLTIYLPEDTIMKLASVATVLQDDADDAITEEFRTLTQDLADWVMDFSSLLQKTGVRTVPERMDLGNH